MLSTKIVVDVALMGATTLVVQRRHVKVFIDRVTALVVMVVLSFHALAGSAAETDVLNWAASYSIPIYGQRVVLRVPAGWKPATEGQAQGFYQMEIVPKDQSVRDWQQLITVQGMRDLAAKQPLLTPVALLSMMGSLTKKACGDEHVYQSLGDLKIDSFDAHWVIDGCARLPKEMYGAKAGQREIAVKLAIKGISDFYIIQRAVRGDATGDAAVQITPSLAADFLRQIQPIKLCDKSDPLNLCWERAAR